MKQSRRAVGVLIAIFVVSWLGLDLWGRNRLAAYNEIWHKDIATERGRVNALRMPVLRGEPIEENAVARYGPLLNRIWDSDYTKPHVDPTAVASAISAGVAGPVPPAAQSKLDASRSDIAAMREALQGNRADWGTQWEKGWAAEIPSLLGARILAQLTLLEGFESVRAGDLRAAAERDLDTMRFGSDFATSGSLITDLIGVAIHRMATDALGTLVTTQKPTAILLGQIQAELAKLDPVVPRVLNGMRGERLSWGHLTVEQPSSYFLEKIDGWEGSRWALFYHLHAVPRRAVAAHALSEIDPLLREVERALAEMDPAQEEHVRADTTGKVATTRNPIVRAAMPNLLRTWVAANEARARFGLLVAAVRLEQAQLRDHRYPAELADLATDPFGSPAKLRYQPTPDGAGYKLWSIGTDRKDQGGETTNSADIVLERKS